MTNSKYKFTLKQYIEYIKSDKTFIIFVLAIGFNIANLLLHLFLYIFITNNIINLLVASFFIYLLSINYFTIRKSLIRKSELVMAEKRVNELLDHLNDRADNVLEKVTELNDSLS